MRPGNAACFAYIVGHADAETRNGAACAGSPRHARLRRVFRLSRLAEPGEPLSGHFLVAMILGTMFSLVVGCGLMALVFYSSRHGYDEPPDFRK